MGGFPSLAGKIWVKGKDVDGDWLTWSIIDDYFKPSRFFGDPKEWKPVLIQYPNLRINFAHFGEFDMTPESGWAWQIIKLMKKYHNVYSDISFCVEENAVLKIEEIVADNPKVANRLMFGTDFIMIMTTKEMGGLENYFNGFDGLSEKMMFDNAQKFLGLN